MKAFRCFIRGDNFPMEQDGRPVLMGWYTTRWVRAEDPESAEYLVLDQLRADPTLAHNRDGSKAEIFFEEIVEIEEIEFPAKQGGFTFFEMEPQRDQSESECRQ